MKSYSLRGALGLAARPRSPSPCRGRRQAWDIPLFLVLCTDNADVSSSGPQLGFLGDRGISRVQELRVVITLVGVKKKTQRPRLTLTDDPPRDGRGDCWTVGNKNTRLSANSTRELVDCGPYMRSDIGCLRYRW